MFDLQSNNNCFTAFKSHKVVRAAKINTIYSSGCVGVEPDGKSVSFDPKGRPTPQIGWYILMYEDGYISFSPPEAFETGYKQIGEDPAPVTPVAGYRPQSDSALRLVNNNKQIEESILRLLDGMKRPDVDGRWLAVGRTHIEQGFMAINRAIFQPDRVKLPTD